MIFLVTNTMPIRLFISHSSADVDITQALVSLLESKFYFDEREIRCTSLQPYRLPTGSQTASRLKQELQEAELVLCILTPVSTESEWVGFELGAAWGMANKWVVPMLVGLDYDDVPGPLRELTVLKATESGSIYQLLDEIAERLKWQTRSAARTDGAVRSLVDMAREYAGNEFPLSNFDVEDFFNLEEFEIDPASLECIALLMSNIDRIELVDGTTGRRCTGSLLKVFRDAFLSCPVKSSITAEKSEDPFEPDDPDSWQGATPWNIDNATHYQLVSKLSYSNGEEMHIFDFTIANEEDGTKGRNIEEYQVRWIKTFAGQ